MNTYPILLRCALVSAAFLCIGCGEDEEVLGPIQTCPASVIVSISTGSTVVISWVPNCRLSSLCIGSSLLSYEIWAIHGNGNNVIAPPVTYGIVPDGASLSFGPPKPLIPGKKYYVKLYRWIGPGQGDGQRVGVDEFVR